MLFYQIILIELLIGFVTLGALFAYKRKPVKQIVLTAAVPAAFALAIGIVKLRLFDFSASIVGLLGSAIPKFNEVLEKSQTTGALIGYTVRAVADHIIAMLLFVIVLLLLRAVIGCVFSIIESRTEKSKKENKNKEKSEEKAKADAPAEADKKEKEEKKKAPKDKKELICRILVTALGGIKGYAIFMFLLLPLVFILNILTPAYNELDKYNETQEMEDLQGFSYDLVMCAGKTVPMYMARYTGFYAINSFASDIICKDTLNGNNGKTYDIEGSGFLSDAVTLGVNALAACGEFIPSNEITEKAFESASDAIDKVADMPILLAVANELIEGLKIPEDDSLKHQFIALLKETYSTKNSEKIGEDLKEVSDLLEYLKENTKDDAIDKNKISEELFIILRDIKNSEDIVRIIAGTHIFGDGSSLITAFGIDKIGTSLNLIKNKEEHYKYVVLSLAEKLNDRTVGDIDFDAVDEFIKYAAKEGLDPDDYKVEDHNNLSTIDYSYENYVRYMKRMKELQKAAHNCALQKENPTEYFVASNGKIYYRASLSDKNIWQEEAPETVVGGRMILELLLREATVYQNNNAENSITTALVIEWSRKLTLEYISELYNGTAFPEELIEAEADLALKTADENNFSSHMIYTEKILEDFKNSYSAEMFDEEGIKKYAKIIASIAELMNVLNTSEGFVVDEIISNFGQIGVLLDAINAFEGTSNIPENILNAIRYSKDYSTYFNLDSIDTIIKNIENGDSNYENLFYTIQSIYGIFQEIN